MPPALKIEARYEDPAGALLQFLDVITSYSIHYTKLYELCIVDFPRQRDASISFLARPLDDPRIPPLLRISWYEAPERPEIGDVWQFEVRLRRPRGTSNPGVFDYEAWLFRQRIGATGYVVNGSRNQRLEQSYNFV